MGDKAMELFKRRGRRAGLSVPNSLYSLYERTAAAKRIGLKAKGKPKRAVTLATSQRTLTLRELLGAVVTKQSWSFRYCRKSCSRAVLSKSAW